MIKYMSKKSRNVIFSESKKQRKTTQRGEGIGGHRGGLPTICPLFLKNVIVKTEKNFPSLGF